MLARWVSALEPCLIFLLVPFGARQHLSSDGAWNGCIDFCLNRAACGADTLLEILSFLPAWRWTGRRSAVNSETTAKNGETFSPIGRQFQGSRPFATLRRWCAQLIPRHYRQAYTIRSRQFF